VRPPPFLEALRHQDLAIHDNECHTGWSLPPVFCRPTNKRHSLYPWPSQARDRVATSGVRLSPFSIAGLTTTRLRDSACSFRHQLLIVLQANLDRMVFPPCVTVGLVPTDPAGSHRQSDLGSRPDQIYVCRTSAWWLLPACAGSLPRIVALARHLSLVPFPAVELAPFGISWHLQELASRFSFQPSFPSRSLRPARAEGTYRYVIGTAKTVIISGLSSAGLRRWMWPADDRVDKIGCRLRNS